MGTFLRWLRRRRTRYTPLIQVIVYRERILHNLKAFQNRSPQMRIAPVLKSNAYGHGLVEVANILDAQWLPFFCVDSFYEALVLRHAGIRTPLLILGYTPLETIQASKLHDVAFSLLSFGEVKKIAQELKTSRTFHLKIDTGMHRYGILPAELSESLTLISHTTFIHLEGAFSHLADADTANSAMTMQQIAQWNAAKKILASHALPQLKYFHVAATAGADYTATIDANLMRLGVGLYGMYDHDHPPAEPRLQPALEMRSRITSLRTLPAGEHIGYNGTFRTDKTMTIATVPAGYYEGIDRRLSSKGFVTVHGIPCPIIGRVSMNITSIDVSAVANAKLDDPVILISADPQQPNSIENIAAACNTLQREILIHIPAPLRRVVVE